ncbi:MAG: hypothetical protein KC472_08255 [Dehalococcoidia bacterium]|nr:hypothetical protein [Dehalococcoidia bacterium]
MRSAADADCLLQGEEGVAIVPSKQDGRVRFPPPAPDKLPRQFTCKVSREAPICIYFCL